MTHAQTLQIPFVEFPEMAELTQKTIEKWQHIRENLGKIWNLEKNDVTLPDNLNVTKKSTLINTMCKAKPFVKWAGGKGQMLSQLEALLPENFDELHNVTYVEPFVGGGAMLFHMLKKHKNITRAVINDINPDLIHCYELIAHNPQALIERLRVIEDNYYHIQNIDNRKELYLAYREQFNQEGINPDERAAIFIFLNHTCYNGLYRVNKEGKFNVPHGKYKHPIICNEELIMLNHELLNTIDLVICNPGDYRQIIRRISRNYPNFIYFDPPYRPLYPESNFKEYSTSPFGDLQQQELKHFCDVLTMRGSLIMLSNSDSLNADGSSFFEDLYEGYNVQRVLAHRYINTDPEKRKKQTEVLICNY